MLYGNCVQLFEASTEEAEAAFVRKRIEAQLLEHARNVLVFRSDEPVRAMTSGGGEGDAWSRSIEAMCSDVFPDGADAESLKLLRNLVFHVLRLSTRFLPTSSHPAAMSLSSVLSKMPCSEEYISQVSACCLRVLKSKGSRTLLVLEQLSQTPCGSDQEAVVQADFDGEALDSLLTGAPADIKTYFRRHHNAESGGSSAKHTRALLCCCLQAVLQLLLEECKSKSANLALLTSEILLSTLSGSSGSANLWREAARTALVSCGGDEASLTTAAGATLEDKVETVMFLHAVFLSKFDAVFADGDDMWHSQPLIKECITFARLVSLNLATTVPEDGSTVVTGGRRATLEDFSKMSCSSGAAERCLDGIRSTYWQSNSGGCPHWVQVDLKAGLHIVNVAMELDVESGDESYRPSKVKVKVSTYGNASWVEVDGGSAIDIPDANGVYTLANFEKSRPSVRYTTLQLHIISNSRGGCNSRIRSLIITVAPETQVCQRRQRREDDASALFKVCDTVMESTRRVEEVLATIAAVAGQQESLHVSADAGPVLDELQACVCKHVELCVAALCDKLSATGLMKYLEGLLSGCSEQGCGDATARAEVSRVLVNRQAFLHALSALQSPQDTLMLLGCSRSEQAWRETALKNTTDDAHWSLIEKMLGDHVTGTEQRALDLLINRRLSDIIFRFVSALFICNSRGHVPALERFVTLYVRRAAEHIDAAIQRKQLSSLAHSILPGSLVPLLVCVCKLKALPTAPELLAKLATLLQQAASAVGATGSEQFQLFCQHGHQLLQPDALERWSNSAGSPVKVGDGRKLYCSQTRANTSAKCAPTAQCSSCQELQAFFAKVSAASSPAPVCSVCGTQTKPELIALVCPRCTVIVCAQCKRRRIGKAIAARELPSSFSWLALSIETLTALLARKLLSVSVHGDRRFLAQYCRFRSLFPAGCLPDEGRTPPSLGADPSVAQARLQTLLDMLQVMLFKCYPETRMVLRAGPVLTVWLVVCRGLYAASGAQTAAFLGDRSSAGEEVSQWRKRQCYQLPVHPECVPVSSWPRTASSV